MITRLECSEAGRRKPLPPPNRRKILDDDEYESFMAGWRCPNKKDAEKLFNEYLELIRSKQDAISVAAAGPGKQDGLK